MGIVALLVLGGLLAAEPMDRAGLGMEPPTLPEPPAPPVLPPEPDVTPPAPAPTPADESAPPPTDDAWTAVPVQSIVADDRSAIESGQLLDPWAPRRRGRIHRSIEGDLRNPFEHPTPPSPRSEPLAQVELRDPFAGHDIRLPAPHLRGPVPPAGPVELRDPFGRRETPEPRSAPCDLPSEPGQAAPPSTGRCLPAPPASAPDA